MNDNEFTRTKHELEAIQRVGKIGFFNYNFVDSRETWSIELYRLLEIEPDMEMSFDDLFEYVIPEDHHILISESEKLLTKNKPVSSEFRIKTNKGQLKYVSTNIELLKDEKGNPKEIFGIIQDITKRKKIEKNLKQSLKDKEILISEIHHRVKNNLQIIVSLLGLQESYIKNDAIAVNVLKESQNRVISMAMIHEMLYQSPNLSHIDFSDYIKNLISHINYSYGSKNINIKLKTEPIDLNIETAIPLGLIINELVSNSLKYAFPNNEPGEISISLNSYDNGYQLIISDNGMGLPEEVDFKNREQSLGLKLVTSLTQQLDGTIDLDRSQGTKYIIKFNELKYKERY